MVRKIKQLQVEENIKKTKKSMGKKYDLKNFKKLGLVRKWVEIVINGILQYRYLNHKRRKGKRNDEARNC